MKVQLLFLLFAEELFPCLRSKWKKKIKQPTSFSISRKTFFLELFIDESFSVHSSLQWRLAQLQFLVTPVCEMTPIEATYHFCASCIRDIAKIGSKDQ